MRLAVLALAVTALGCRDAQMAKFSGLGNEHHVKCYSGGQLIYEGTSTGKVSSEQSSDGYYFLDKSRRHLMEVSGDCVIEMLE